MKGAPGTTTGTARSISPIRRCIRKLCGVAAAAATVLSVVQVNGASAIVGNSPTDPAFVSMTVTGPDGTYYSGWCLAPAALVPLSTVCADGSSEHVTVHSVSGGSSATTLLQLAPGSYTTAILHIEPSGAVASLITAVILSPGSTLACTYDPVSGAACGTQLPTISSAPIASDITSGQTLGASILTGGSTTVTGTFAWADPLFSPPVGTTDQTVVFTPTDATLSPLSFTIPITVNAVPTAVATITMTVSGTDGTYFTGWCHSGAALVALSMVCSDGSSEHVTVHSVIGGASDASVIELAPGTYTTAVLVQTGPGGHTDSPIHSVTVAAGASVNCTYTLAAGAVCSGTATASVDITTAPTVAPIPEGTSLGATPLLGGIASVPGSFAWVSPATVPPVGTSLQLVTFIPGDSLLPPVTFTIPVLVNPTVVGPVLNDPLSVGNGTISGSFSPGTVPAPTSFTVVAVPAPGLFSGLPTRSVTVTPPATSFTLTGLVNRIEYWVTVTATNADSALTSSALVATPFVRQPAPTQVTAGAAHSCARLADATARCWGRNTNGQLGDGTLRSSTTPVSPRGLTKVAQIEAGDQFTCAVVSAGPTGKVKCWGLNSNGQLGVGDITRRSAPALVTSAGTTPLSGVSQVAAGANFACALLGAGANGTVRCWGANTSGQLGDGTTTQRLRPVVVKRDASTVLRGVKSISAGGGTACAVLTNGRVWCWGLGTSGQLGNNGTGSSRFAVATSVLTSATSVSVGGNFACARTAVGAVFCWGNNSKGQLGDGTLVARRTPVAVVDGGCGFLPCIFTGDSGFTAGAHPQAATRLTGSTSIAAGAESMCIIRGSGTAAVPLCWGSNVGGQLGVGTTSPVIDGALTVRGAVGAKAIAVGNGHILAVVPSTLRPPSDIVVWGANGSGQLGVAGGTRTSPVVNPFI